MFFLRNSRVDFVACEMLCCHPDQSCKLEPQEWDDNDAGAERNTQAAAKDDEVDLEEDGIQRRRKPLRSSPAELLATTCRQGHEMQPEKKKSNRCNLCGCSGTAFRCRDCDYDLCEPCQRNMARRVPVRFQEGDRMLVKGAGYNRKDGVDWRFCFYAGSDCIFSFAPCTQRKCILRLGWAMTTVSSIGT